MKFLSNMHSQLTFGQHFGHFRLPPEDIIELVWKETACACNKCMFLGLVMWIRTIIYIFSLLSPADPWVFLQLRIDPVSGVKAPQNLWLNLLACISKLDRVANSLPRSQGDPSHWCSGVRWDMINQYLKWQFGSSAGSVGIFIPCVSSVREKIRSSHRITITCLRDQECISWRFAMCAQRTLACTPVWWPTVLGKPLQLLNSLYKVREGCIDGETDYEWILDQANVGHFPMGSNYHHLFQFYSCKTWKRILWWCVL